MENRDRFIVEREKWDAHAKRESARLVPSPPDATFERYANGSLLMTGATAWLGPLEGKSLLEVGCGLGAITVLLARSGAHVTALDLSEESVAVARERVRISGLEDRVTFVITEGEALPFADNTFDLAFGKAVLHHIEPKQGARELARVLKPGGRAAFSEPMGQNPLLNFARDHLPYPGKHERGADIPLRASDLRDWKAPFRRTETREVQLLAMLERALGFGKKLPILRRIDGFLLARVPPLRRFCRYVVVLLEK